MEARPRHHRDRILLLPRKEWKEAILKTVPTRFQNMVRDHLNDFVFKSKCRKAIDEKPERAAIARKEAKEMTR